MIILLDAFGTLFDTQNKSILATKAIFSKYLSAIDPDEIYAKWKYFHRQTISNLSTFIKEKDIFILGLEYLFHQYQINGNAKDDVEIMLSSIENRPLFNDVMPFLKKLNGEYKVYIASNSDYDPLFQNIEKTKLPISGFFCSEKLQAYKPNNKFYKSIQKRLNIPFSDFLFIGDSLQEDVYAPAQLGIKSIWLNRKNTPSLDKSIIQISNLNELSL
jgi:2-haloalkanoic acid dehalogenase type II